MSNVRSVLLPIYQSFKVSMKTCIRLYEVNGFSINPKMILYSTGYANLLNFFDTLKKKAKLNSLFTLIKVRSFFFFFLLNFKLNELAFQSKIDRDILLQWWYKIFGPHSWRRWDIIVCKNKMVFVFHYHRWFCYLGFYRM